MDGLFFDDTFFNFFFFITEYTWHSLYKDVALFRFLDRLNPKHILLFFIRQSSVFSSAFWTGNTCSLLFVEKFIEQNC